MNTYTFDEICESRDFDHDTEFIKADFYTRSVAAYELNDRTLRKENKRLREELEAAVKVANQYYGERNDLQKKHDVAVVALREITELHASNGSAQGMKKRAEKALQEIEGEMK